MKKFGFLLVLLVFSVSLVWGADHWTESFENPDSWSGYTTGTVNFDSGDWDFIEVYPENSSNSYDGSKACRINDDEAGASITSPAVNSVGTVTFYYHRPFSGTGSFELQKSVGGGSYTTLATVDYSSVTSPTQYSYDVNDASDNIRIRIENDDNTAHLTIDYVTLTDYSGGGPVPPSISNIVQTPSTDITSSTTVSVSADVTAGDAAIDYVELHYGTASGSLTNTISMSLDTGDTYITDSDIPAQSDGTTVYYEIYAIDEDTEDATSLEQSYTVSDPATTIIPYSESFDSDLGDCYTYSVSGATKEWYHNTDCAAINGYNSGDTEEDWLILPGIKLDNYSDEVLTFDSWYRFGSDDTNNYLKLHYSTDYNGLGDPSSATWEELSYNQPSTDQTWTGSGNVDLSGISGTSVWIAFEYHYQSGSYRWWQIDNLSILELSVIDPTNFTATAVSTTEIDLSWTLNGNGNDVMIAMGYSNAFGEPVDGTSYSVGDTSLSDGGEVIYKGSGTSYTHTTYDSNIHCYFKAWSVNGSNNYSPGVEDDATTFKVEPTNHVTDFTATANGYDIVDLSWTNNDGAQAADAFIVFASTDSYDAIIGPSDGTEYTDDTDLSDGSGNIIVNNARGIYSWTELSELTTYYFKIYPFTNSGTDIDYKTDGTIPQDDATTEEEPVMVTPEVGTVFISEVADAGDDFNAEYIELYNNSDDIIDLSNSRIVMDESTDFPISDYPGDTTIPANGTFIMTRGATKLEFETEWGTLPVNCNYNEGSGGMYFGTGTARRWQLVYDDGTRADVIIDDTQTTVAGSGNRSYQNPIGTWNTEALGNATPGNLDDDQPLPVALSTFSIVMQNSPTLYWTTESESNNAYWNIYRSISSNFGQAIWVNENNIIEGYGTTTVPHDYEYSDPHSVQGNATYWYWLESIDVAGNNELYGPIELQVPEGGDGEGTPIVPKEYGLHQNYPNPFNPSTMILFALEENAYVDLEIFNAQGQKVKTLLKNEFISGKILQQIDWDSKDDDGKKMSSGIYLYRLQTAEKTWQKKMLLIK